MKKITLITLMLFTALGYAQVGINTNNPDASSALEIESTSGGILIPRMTELQRDAIISPAMGLMVYQNDNNIGFYFYNGAQWTNVAMSGPAGPQGEVGPQGQQGPPGADGQDGAVGPAGTQGEQGIQGPAGADGQDGAVGPAGPAGADGQDGVDGTVGPSGPQGEQGIQGPAGPQGQQGETGAAGNGIASSSNNGDGTFTLTFDDGTSFTTQDLTGPAGADAIEQDTFADQDGNTASTSDIGPAIWMTENVKIVTYRDGTPIPEVTDNNEWSNLTTGAWCYLNNDPNNNYLGKLYNWYALMGIHDNDPNTPDKEFAPPGWQVPTRADFAQMEQYYISLGHNHEYPDNDVSNIYTSAFEQKMAKAISSQSGWLINNDLTVGTPGHDQYLNNSTGFNLSPDTGKRRWGDGVFYVAHTNAYLWTKSLKIFNVSTNSVGNVHIYDVYYMRDFTILSDTNPKAGLPVRLIRY